MYITQEMQLQRLGYSEGHKDRKGEFYMPYVKIFGDTTLKDDMMIAEKAVELYSNKDGTTLTVNQIRDMKLLSNLPIIHAHSKKL